MKCTIFTYKYIITLLLCPLYLYSQQTEPLPPGLKNLPLKPNQTLSNVISSDRYHIKTYLDNGVITKNTRDSLAAESWKQVENLLHALPDSVPCEMIQCSFLDRFANYYGGILCRFWLQNRKIIRIDSTDSEEYSSASDYPLQENQFGNYFQEFSSIDKNKNRFDFKLYNIVTVKNEPINGDSLEMDSQRNLLLFLKHRSDIAKKLTRIRIYFIEQCGENVIAFFDYPLKAMNREPAYYQKKFNNIITKRR